jgi:hypothetical protein
MQDAAFDVHLGQNQVAGLGYTQAMPEHEEQEAAIAGFIPGPLGGSKKLVHLKAGQMFSLVDHFV